MRHGMMDGMGAFLFGYLLLAALFLFAVVAGAILLVRALWRPDHAAHHGDAVGTPSASDILEERYARGEIDDDDFNRRRRTMGRTP
jgi:putative membrane protein